MEPYKVIPVRTKNSFERVLAQHLKIEDKTIPQKEPMESQIFGYLSRYMKTEPHCLETSTIVCETEYTCLNYLEDYANYYSRTYTNYSKKCKRLHFFSEVFDKRRFQSMILNPDDELWEKYLGCIVVKPIPRGTIGVTYLKTYDHSGTADGRGKAKERFYKCLTSHTINLFGKELEIKTMPFKEQDGVVASCATSALWMAFQKTSELFNSSAPSLSEITILAGEEGGTGRIFPSKGLSTFQVLTAISKLKMTPVIEEFFDNASYFKSALHAHIKGDIPVLLGLIGIEGERNNYNHLVTVNGYRYKEVNKYSTFSPNENFKLLSDSIDVFYVNDDQVGPFARTIIDNKENSNKIKIITSWKKKDNGQYIDKNIEANPGFIIVPLSSSIRVLFRDIYICYTAISRLFSGFICKALAQKLCVNYDIYLIRSNEYKKNLISEKMKWKNHEEKDKRFREIIMSSLPKYIWVIEARNTSGELLFDFLYDSVESKYNSMHIMVNIFNDEIQKIIDSTKSPQIINSFCGEYTKFKNSSLRTLIYAARYNTIPLQEDSLPKAKKDRGAPTNSTSTEEKFKKETKKASPADFNISSLRGPSRNGDDS